MGVMAVAGIVDHQILLQVQFYFNALVVFSVTYFEVGGAILLVEKRGSPLSNIQNAITGGVRSHHSESCYLLS